MPVYWLFKPWAPDVSSWTVPSSLLVGVSGCADAVGFRAGRRAMAGLFGGSREGTVPASSAVEEFRIGVGLLD